MVGSQSCRETHPHKGSSGSREISPSTGEVSLLNSGLSKWRQARNSIHQTSGRGQLSGAAWFMMEVSFVERVRRSARTAMSR
ncbi:hypothetical protein RRG08_065236 [Elysia crispata]|uniref:Uncharacterized protein n=1 Tax=Elysia crispata TaxID=231223 RepID=A0AAE0YI26_9GAST|nr:hypothetical protein RRG08_065236 [Elysia crispata]